MAWVVRDAALATQWHHHWKNTLASRTIQTVYLQRLPLLPLKQGSMTAESSAVHLVLLCDTIFTLCTNCDECCKEAACTAHSLAPPPLPPNRGLET